MTFSTHSSTYTPTTSAQVVDYAEPQQTTITEHTPQSGDDGFSDFFTTLYNTSAAIQSLSEIEMFVALLVTDEKLKSYVLSKSPFDLKGMCLKKYEDQETTVATRSLHFKNLLKEIQLAAFRHSEYWERLKEFQRNEKAYYETANIKIINQHVNSATQALVTIETTTPTLKKEEATNALNQLASLKPALESIRSLKPFADPFEFDVFSFLIENLQEDLFEGPFCHTEASDLLDSLQALHKWIKEIESKAQKKHELSCFQVAGQLTQRLASAEIALKRHLADLNTPVAYQTPLVVRSQGQKIYDTHGLAILNGIASQIHELLIQTLIAKLPRPKPLQDAIKKVNKDMGVNIPEASKLKNYAKAAAHISREVAQAVFDTLYPKNDLESLAIDLLNKMPFQEAQDFQKALSEVDPQLQEERDVLAKDIFDKLLKRHKMTFLSLPSTSNTP